MGIRMRQSRCLCLSLSVAVLFLCSIGTFHVILSTNDRHGNGITNQLNRDLQRKRESVGNRRQPLGSERFGYGSNQADAFHLRDMDRLKDSVQKELRQLDLQRKKLRESIDSLTSDMQSRSYQLTQYDSEISNVKAQVNALMLERDELKILRSAEVRLPLRLPIDDVIGSEDNAHDAGKNLKLTCTMERCFNYARCPLFSPLKVFIYEDDQLVQFNGGGDFGNSGDSDAILKALRSLPYITTDAKQACLFIVPMYQHNKWSKLSFKFANLPHWGETGRNHILFIPNSSPQSSNILSNSNSRHSNSNIGAAMVAQSSFVHSSYRTGYDIVLPHMQKITSLKSLVWQELPDLLPVTRPILLSFEGKLSSNNLKRYSSFTPFNAGLKKLAQENHQKGVHFNLDCASSEEISKDTFDSEWVLCGTEADRGTFLLKSKYVLTIAPLNSIVSSSPLLFQRLYEALKHGAVPVIFGETKLPFEENVPWDKAIVTLPKSRITEVLYLLQSINNADHFEMRRQGRLIYENFLGSHENVVETVLSVVRTRLKMPAPVIRPEKATLHTGFGVFTPVVERPEGLLGPLESPYPSPMYQRNFTMVTRLFDTTHPAFHMYESDPWGNVLPTDAQFNDPAAAKYRPINLGRGGSGKEFSESIGGNYEREQFTIVILAYDRLDVLQSHLAHYKDLPYLHHVVVVLNNPVGPPATFKLPDIGVKISVIKPEKNSLNNRFIPWDIIETEAILSFDDDVYLQHDEIIFAFRVWREKRDELVGFPGRYHAYDPVYGGWHYNSNHSCQLSLVLTGAAFYHKYYMYAYTHLMPQAIRDKVDEFMNCEDLAMNFLIAHMTRKPPIKVTSRWNFVCQNCGDNRLWTHDGHFEERNKCINFFRKVYGYMPLLFTQFRVDSVLFKTRVPSAHQKCFKYV